MALPVEQHAVYAVIIDRILAASDLNTISAKSIRKSLQEEVGVDLTPQKSAITELIMERFDETQVSEDTAPEKQVSQDTSTNGTNGHAQISPSPPSPAKRKAESEESNSFKDESPAPKKAKKNKAVESDAQIAARLQAELNAGTRARATRGGGAKRKQPIKREKKSKKKSSAKVNSDDDSDVESGSTAKPEKKKKGGFHKSLNLSEPLSALLGETQLSRPQTVKKIWEYVKERGLQNPKDKRQILCDEKMQAVFKGDSVHMFTMNKLLAHHLYPVEDVS